MEDDRFVSCSEIKIQNKPKYNLSGRGYLAEVANVTGIGTKWFRNLQRFELWRVIFPTEVENWFEYAGFRITEGSRNRGKLTVLV